MAITVEPVILLPTMDSERFERCAFSMRDRESLLTVYLTELPAFVIQLIPIGIPEGRTEGHRPEGGAADTEHHNVGESLPPHLRELLHIVDQVS